VSDMLHKAFVLMLSASIPGEVMAARDTVMRLSRAGPHELAAALLQMGDVEDEDEVPTQVAWLERIYRRVKRQRRA
jgi:hypothetical protein